MDLWAQVLRLNHKEHLELIDAANLAHATEHTRDEMANTKQMAMRMSYLQDDAELQGRLLAQFRLSLVIQRAADRGEPLSLEALASATGLSDSDLTRAAFSGAGSPAARAAVTAALGVKPAWIYEGREDPKWYITMLRRTSMLADPTWEAERARILKEYT